jgi:hypothetical protein
MMYDSGSMDVLVVQTVAKDGKCQILNRKRTTSCIKTGSVDHGIRA